MVVKTGKLYLSALS